MLTLHRRADSPWHDRPNEARSHKEFYICSERWQVMRRIFHFPLENARIDTRYIHIHRPLACLISSLSPIFYRSHILYGDRLQ